MKKIIMMGAVALGMLGVARAEVVKYRDYDATTGKFTDVERDCTIILVGSNLTLEDGKWYAVRGMVRLTTITVNGSANLILTDGCQISVNNGIIVKENNSLNIYGQSAGTGKLTATGSGSGAGIGGGNMSAGGTVTINGGVVTATGGSGGAGIGGGYMGAGGKVTINGGTVTATGSEGGAGIGGGHFGAGGEVTINGGVVTAQGSQEKSTKEGSAGIGNGRGYKNEGGAVTINGGTVTATGGAGGAGIGGCYNGKGCKVTINGGIVYAYGCIDESTKYYTSKEQFGSGIGGGADGYGGGEVILGEYMFAYDITGGEPGTRIVDMAKLISVQKLHIVNGVVTVGKMKVKINEEALNGIFGGKMPTAAELMATRTEGNERPLLDCYVLGLDKDDAASKPLINKRKASAVGKLALGLDNVKVNTASGVTPKFTLKASTDNSSFAAVSDAQAEPEFEIDLPSDKVKYYKIEYEME